MKRALILFIRLYRLTISPMLGNCCRFEPSCSQYGMEAVDKHGAFKGIFLIFKRVCKCNPWHEGGPDPVP